MESLTFDYAPGIEWYCIEWVLLAYDLKIKCIYACSGGTDQIATKMKEKIKGTVTMGARVTALAIQPENPNHTVEDLTMSLQRCHLDACATLTPLVAFFHGICKQLSALSRMTARQRLPSDSLAVGGNKTISSSAVVYPAPTVPSARLFTHPMEWTRFAISKGE